MLLLANASPRFESVGQRFDSLPPDAQLGAAWTEADAQASLEEHCGKQFGPDMVQKFRELFTAGKLQTLRRFDNLRKDSRYVIIRPT